MPFVVAMQNATSYELWARRLSGELLARGSRKGTQIGFFALFVPFARFVASATPIKHGKTTEESLHSSVSVYAIYLWDHDGTEDPETQWWLLGSGSRRGDSSDDRRKDGPALRVPWRHRASGSSSPSWQRHQSNIVQCGTRGNNILWCSYLLLHLVRQPTYGRKVHSLGPHLGATLGLQDCIQLPERKTHAAWRHRLQFLPRT